MKTTKSHRYLGDMISASGSYQESLTGLDARVATAAEVRTELRRRDPDMTEDEEKTAGLLCQALQARNCIWMEGLDTTGITTQIDNLCVN